MPETSDASASAPIDRLLVAVGEGDRGAYAALYDTVAGMVFGTIKRVVRDPSITEEVAQDVLLEVWQKAPRFQQEAGSGLAWILTIAHRRAVDRVRSEQASRDRSERVGRAGIDRPFDAVADQVIERDERRRVKENLAALTELQREAIEMAFFDGRTYREVAELLEVPLGTVKTRIRDGLLRLCRTMEVRR